MFLLAHDWDECNTKFFRRRRGVSSSSQWLKGETSVQLNLTPCTDSTENSADVAGEITRYVFEHRVAIPSQGERALCVAWDCEVRAIKQIVGFHSKRKLGALRQMEVLL